MEKSKRFQVLKETLYEAICDNDLDTVRFIVPEKISVDTPILDDVTPLMVAVVEGMRKIVKYFIEEAGADVNQQNRSTKATLLHMAAGQGNEYMVSYLLKKGANVNAKDLQRNTPLHIAVMLRKLSVVRRLIDAGADVNAKDDIGRTPLHYACICEAVGLVNFGADLEVVKCLVEVGARVNEQDNKGNTPLHYTAMPMNCKENVKAIEDVIKYLLEKGADPYIRNKEGKSPMDVAPGNRVIKRIKTESSLRKKQRSMKGLVL